MAGRATHARLFRRVRDAAARWSLATGTRTTDFEALRSRFTSAGVRYNHMVSRSSTLVTGYTFRRAEPDVAQPLTFHDIDIGIDYHRSLGRTRRTTVSFSSGTALVKDDAGEEYRVLGEARLTHLIGRSWTAGVGYHRGLEFLEALSSLAATDAFTGVLNGFATPAMELTFTGKRTHTDSWAEPRGRRSRRMRSSRTCSTACRATLRSMLSIFITSTNLASIRYQRSSHRISRGRAPVLDSRFGFRWLVEERGT